MKETINLSPNWSTAMRIYIEVLKNKNASVEAKKAAEEDLMDLANTVDKMVDNKEH